VGIADRVPNDFVEELTRQHPDRFVPVGGLNPASLPDAVAVRAEVCRLAERGHAGVKLHPRVNGYHPLDPKCLAAFDAAAEIGLVVYFCTFCRQHDRSVPAIADVVDRIATGCRPGPVVLLHGGGTSMLDLFELVRMHRHLTLDLSFSLMRYRGSSLDDDMRFLCSELDQRLVVGSDFPEISPGEAFRRVDALVDGLAEGKRANILHRNLETLFAGWSGSRS
jgi:predicted TIM-barrel fold metal-dependent hydrolase